MKNQIKTVLLLGGLSIVLVAIGGAIGEVFFWGALVVAAAINLGSYFYSDRIVLKMHRAQPIDPAQAPRLHGVVEELARSAGIPKPRVYLIDDPQPNAFATGRNPAHGVVAVTSGILNLLSERELRGVLAHELAHVQNRDILVATVAAAIAAAVTWIAHGLQFMAFFGGVGGDDEEGEGSLLGALLMALVAPIAATLIQLGISRSREFLADESGARISGDPQALASALRKLEQGVQAVPHHAEPATASLFIVNPLTGGRALARMLSTHPPMDERIERLEAMARGGSQDGTHRLRSWRHASDAPSR
jgi:heat shock protein HtpX